MMWLAALVTITALRLEPHQTVHLDGRLDEEFWRNATAAGDFVQQDPDNGAAATERTEVRIVYDAHRLVLGVVCFDSAPSELHGNQMQRDQPLTSDDRFIVTIDTFLDGRTGYYFEINPSGAMGDALIIPSTSGAGAQPANLNRSWDGIWDARVIRTAAGWSAEIEIPFRTLNFDPHAETWGINFQRTIRRKNEETLWTAYPRNQGVTFMEAAGRLSGLTGLTQGLGVDVRPYWTGSSTTAPGRAAPDAVTRGTYGGDLFYNLTPGLRANVTVNTDFAETEVDQRQVNLTRFPLFFPEKRTFFLEGSSFFDFSREPGNTIVPFFSRRVGLDDNGVPQPIDGGVKLTGQAGAFDVGALHVATRETSALAGEQLSAFRVRRRLLAQSYVGGIYTRRAGGGVRDRQSAGLDFALSTAHFRGRDVLELSGFWLTTTGGSIGSGTGSAYGVRVSYPNDPLNARIVVSNVDANYDPAIGFVERRAYRRVNPGVRYIVHTDRHPIVRRFSFEPDIDLRFDPQGRLETRKPDLQVLRVDFQSGDGVELHVFPMLERLPRPFEISSGVTLPAGGVYSFLRRQYRFTSAAQRLIAVNGQYEDGTFYSGDRRQLTSTVTLRPHAGWLFGFTGDYNDVTLREGHFTTTVWRIDVNTQFSPWLSLMQNVQYDTVSNGLGWQARFRWIRKPGDDFYFVYTHNWIDTDTLRTIDRRAAFKVVKTFRF
jgi:uncharacterized protein DUF5916